MKKLLRRALYVPFIFLGFAIAAACPQPFPPVPPGPTPTVLDGGTADVPGSMAQSTCANLAALNCPEGLRADCVTVVQKVLDTRITDLKLGCLIDARTVEAVQACGTVSCRQPQ